MLASLLCPGGAFCFNIPALYLLEPDERGGGSDPFLLSLQEMLLTSPDALPLKQAADRPLASTHVLAPHTPEPLSQSSINIWLQASGLRACQWSFRMRISGRLC